jgi:hypothetical protein
MIAFFLAKWWKKCKRKPAAVASAVLAETVAGATKHRTLSSTRGLTCDKGRFNAEQDHDFGGSGCGARRRSDGVHRAIVHSRQRAESKGVSTRMLR